LQYHSILSRLINRVIINELRMSHNYWFSILFPSLSIFEHLERKEMGGFEAVQVCGTYFLLTSPKVMD